LRLVAFWPIFGYHYHFPQRQIHKIMVSQLHQTLLGLFLFLTLVDIANSMYVTKLRRIPLSFRQAGLMRKRALDALDGQGFGFKKRALDSLDGSGFGFDKRALDSLDGSGFGFDKRALDSLEGSDFRFKRALDMLDGTDFSMKKRALDMLDGTDFSMKKRALDMLDGQDFRFKRALDALDGTGFSMKKRAFDDRYIWISVSELEQLENLKQALRDELRRRRMLVEASQLDRLTK